MSINVYQMVTDRIIEELKKGIIPWELPWTGVRSGAYSRSTGRPYSLLNQMLLRKPGEYLTYKQAVEAGGKVRHGERGKIVVFWKPVTVKEKDKDGKEREKLVPMLRYYKVFHIDQCEGVEPKFTAEHFAPADPIREAEMVLEDYSSRSGCPIILEEHGNEAYYSPSMDQIHMPTRERFPKIAGFYSTAFHEAVHSTGHSTRLNRLASVAYRGDTDYSKEELVAEIGAATLMNELGIETDTTFRNSTAYIQGWLTKLKSDARFIVTAASKAEKAVKLILNIDQEKKDVVDAEDEEPVVAAPANEDHVVVEGISPVVVEEKAEQEPLEPEIGIVENAIRYSEIDEEAARLACGKDYVTGTATEEYRRYVNEASKIAERQKGKVPVFLHGRIDDLLAMYAEKLAANLNRGYALSADPDTGDAAKEQNLQEFDEIHDLIREIRSIDKTAVQPDKRDPMAILEETLEQMELLRGTVKAAMAYFKKHHNLNGCPVLSDEMIEKLNAVAA